MFFFTANPRMIKDICDNKEEIFLHKIICSFSAV